MPTTTPAPATKPYRLTMPRYRRFEGGKLVDYKAGDAIQLTADEAVKLAASVTEIGEAAAAAPSIKGRPSPRAEPVQPRAAPATPATPASTPASAPLRRESRPWMLGQEKRRSKSAEAVRADPVPDPTSEEG